MKARTAPFLVAPALACVLVAGCETDSDWIAAYPGHLDVLPTRYHLAQCDENYQKKEWKRLDAAPPKAEEYLQRSAAGAEALPQGKSEDTWYARKPGEVMLCRFGERTDIGGYHAFWRFREKDGEVIVTESYAWRYIVAD